MGACPFRPTPPGGWYAPRTETDQGPGTELGPGRRACIIKGVTRRSLSTSSNAPDSAAASAATAVTEPSDIARETTLVSAALDSATPAALLAGAIDVEQAPRPLSVFDLMRIGIGPSLSLIHI